MSSRNLVALGTAIVGGVAGGVYTFGPILKAQQEAQERWKNPDAPRADTATQDQRVGPRDQPNGPPGK